MNVVLSALVIILLLYPGIFFRSIYFRGRKADGVYRLKVNILRQPVWEQITASLVPALLIHFLCIVTTTLLNYLVDKQIDYRFLYAFLRNDSLPPAVNLNGYLLNFFAYLCFAFTIAIVTGMMARTVVSNRRLDTKIPLLRFSNEWFYWLTGRILESDEKGQSRVVDLIAVHVLAETKENTIVYDGFLYDFVLSDLNNGLDRIVLVNASKSIYKKTARSSKQAVRMGIEQNTEENTLQSEYYERLEKREIQQEYLIIPYAQVRNLTITYIDLATLTEPTTQT